MRDLQFLTFESWNDVENIHAETLALHFLWRDESVMATLLILMSRSLLWEKPVDCVKASIFDTQYVYFQFMEWSLYSSLNYFSD